MNDDEGLQEYTPSLSEPVRVWVFCRDCRCRLQVRMIPRPETAFVCLCGMRGPLSRFDVLDSEARAREVAEQFEVAYQATKEVLAPIMTMKKTRMFESGEIAALLGSEDTVEEAGASPSEFAGVPAHETEDAYQGQLATLMKELGAAGTDLIARHEALNAVAKFAYARRHLRHAARAVCVRACEADLQQMDAMIRQVRERTSKARLKFPAFRQLVQIYKEAGERNKAMETALRARAVGMPGFDEVLDELRNL